MRMLALGLTEVNGLPAHILLVHAVVVLVPLTALLLVVTAWWPAARRRLGVVAPLVALVTLVAVPLTTHAGEWLRDRVIPTPLVARHAEMGDHLLPWVLGMFLVALVLAVLHRQEHATSSSGGGAARLRVARLVVGVVAVAVSVAAVVEVYRIGESGSRAVWQGHFSPTAQHGRPSRGDG